MRTAGRHDLAVSLLVICHRVNNGSSWDEQVGRNRQPVHASIKDDTMKWANELIDAPTYNAYSLVWNDRAFS